MNKLEGIRFVLVAGDLTNFGLQFEFEEAHTDLSRLYAPCNVPAYFGGPLHSFPFKPIKAGSYSIDILTVGLYFNYTPGKQFFFSATSREEYPKNYYDYSSALRLGVFAGGRIHRKFDSGSFDKIGLYYELGTYDLAVHNYIFNVSKSSFKGCSALRLALNCF